MSGWPPSRWIALVFAVLGGWALLHPASVIALSFRPEYRGGAALGFAVAAFGAQALIAALFAATARFTRATYVGYAAMLLGFLAFDAWFVAVDPVLTALGAGLDALGNLAMLALCRRGWQLVVDGTEPSAVPLQSARQPQRDEAAVEQRGREQRDPPP